MARKPRNSITYDLIGPNGAILYRGKSNDPERRLEEHERDGKIFNSLRVTSVKLTKDSALEREQQALETYQRNHGGKLPKYNKDANG